MENNSQIEEVMPRKTLKDFIRLILSFYVGLIAIALYQNTYLFFKGVLSGIINKSFFLLLLHHSGFTALIGLFLAFLFNYLERKKPTWGFKVCGIVFLVILLVECLLSDYYIREYDILGSGFVSSYFDQTTVLYFISATIIIGTLSYAILHFSYKFSKSLYRTISRMYPFTIILLSLFLATLTSPKRPVNENKTQYLVTHLIKEAIDFNKYNGTVEYPLLRENVPDSSLVPYFNLKQEKPNIVLILVDGLGNNFLGKQAKYPGFTPFLDSLSNKSLYWDHFLSNVRDNYASIPGVLGSLPFGKQGLTNADKLPRGQSLISILKGNGYKTSFNFGGNSALNKLDRFLFDQNVDHLLDDKGFGSSYVKQEADAAGISLGYPDKALFSKWLKNTLPGNTPRLDIFLTLSGHKPYLIPDKAVYEKRVALHVSTELKNHSQSKLIANNKDLFGSMLYTDEALRDFFKAYKKDSSYQNTIFIISGSHNTTELPASDDIERYRVPLIISSPLLKESEHFSSLTSHMDIAPSLLGLLDITYEDINVPDEISWLGTGLVHKDIFKTSKKIPLLRKKNTHIDFISGHYFIGDGDSYELSPQLAQNASEIPDKVEQDFNYFKSVNTYVITNNRIIPPDPGRNTAMTSPTPSKEEIIWINSVFSGSNYDNAYLTAKALAFDGSRDKALILANYILSQVPGHVDTEILIGRIQAWEGNFNQSETILQNVIRKYPVYADAYAALLDTYFWSDQFDQLNEIRQQLLRNGIDHAEIWEKLERAQSRQKQLQNELNKEDSQTQTR